MTHGLGALLLATLSVAAAPVPWLDAPLRPWHYPPPKSIPYPASAPPCKATQLSVHAGRTGAAAGNMLEELVFVHTGQTTCLLRGYPLVRALSPDGAQVVLHPVRGTFFGPLVPADTARGGQVFLDFGTGDGCDGGLRKPVTYRDLVFTLPAGGDVRGGDIRLHVVCGLSMSDFGLPPRYTGSEPAAPGSVGSLQARIHLPAEVRRGSTLDYSVTLANTTRTPVDLDANCPGYTQGLYTPAAHVTGSYRLDCTPVGRLASGSRATFAMQLRVPGNSSLGLAKLGWNLDTETGPSAGGTIAITG